MASESAIKAAIEQIVSSYSNWTIGVTDDPNRRKGEHGNPNHCDLTPKNESSFHVRLANKKKGDNRWSGRHSNRSKSSK